MSDTLSLLQQHESRNVTFIDPAGGWPIVWQRAEGSHVWDEEGRKYLDLTGAFGVAAAGHANPAVVAAGQKQMAELLHAMGDVHPHRRKAELLREVSRLTFERWGRGASKGILGNSGFEAVEAALKTALLATGKPGVIAFDGGYHGLGYGALNVTARDYFSHPFRAQLRNFAQFAPFPQKPEELSESLGTVEALLQGQPIGAVMVEPVQARGGIRVSTPGFLQQLRALCDEHGALLILDEIYTGFGRTGALFACEHENVIPDLICLGKALTGGFPLSVCAGAADIMDKAWPPSPGEALHTSTFLGHPVGCAMALAQIGEIERQKLPEAAQRKGALLLEALHRFPKDHPGFKLEPRGLGLLAGIAISHPDGAPATDLCLDIIKKLLGRGFIFLPEGDASNVLSFTPPLTISEHDLLAAVAAVGEELIRAT